MSVRKRGEFWHYDFAYAGQRFRGPTGQRGKAAALKVEARMRERAALGAPAAVPTMKEAAARWFVARAADKKSAKTIAYRLETALRLIGPDRPVTEIDTPDIEDAMQRRRLEANPRTKRAPTGTTVNRDLIDTTLRPILRYCRRALKVKGLQEIDWPALKLAEPQGRTRTFTMAEIDKWRSALPTYHRPIFDFIGVYGVRLGEAFFPLDSFDAEAGRIVLRQRKNGLPHTVVLLPGDARELAARLGRAREARPKPLPTLWFRQLKSGRLVPITAGAFQAASRRALDRAKIADARAVHDLRHHAATIALRAPGANLKLVQQLLGHESIASTARYAHVDEAGILNMLRHAHGTSSETAEEKPSVDKALGEG
jgi:integrase